MSDKLDYKKQYKDLYQPGNAPALIEVPPMNYLMVDGTGAPEGEDYQQALQLLYAAAFTIKMSRLSGKAPAGYIDYVVPPLEGLWDGGPQGYLHSRREDWRWTSLIRQPDFVTREVFDWTIDELRRKKPELPAARLRFRTYDEGLCVQVMHTGPYSGEDETLERLALFLRDNDLTDDCGPERRHHEIYLSDPRRAKPERMKTVLRHPVRQG